MVGMKDFRSGAVALHKPTYNTWGMTSADFDACYSCTTPAPLGNCTDVAGSTPYDQLSTYKSVLLSSLINYNNNTNCSFAFNSIMLGRQTSNVACDYDPALNMTLLVQVRLSFAD